MAHRKRTLQQGDYRARDYLERRLHRREITRQADYKGGKLLEHLNDRDIIWEDIIRKELHEENYCCYWNDSVL